MPQNNWQTPTLQALRTLNANNITAQLQSGPMIPNSDLRVMADANAGLAFLALLYIDWLSLQLLPDTATGEWLDRQANIWVGGREAATFASGTATASGIAGTIIPAGSQASVNTTEGPILIQTTEQFEIGSGATPFSFIALSAGETGLSVGTVLTWSIATGANSSVIVSAISDGIDEETDDALRARILARIQEPPMGGDANDYVAWALEVPGVTRAWTSPNEMGPGTVTLRFMMDNVRATTNPLTNGFPTADDVTTVYNYIQTKRPVAIKDFAVAAPIPQPINFSLSNLNPDNGDTQAAIAASVSEMLFNQATPAYAENGVSQPASTIFAAWVSAAISAAIGVISFDLSMQDQPAASNGSLAVLGTINYVS